MCDAQGLRLLSSARARIQEYTALREWMHTLETGGTRFAGCGWQVVGQEMPGVSSKSVSQTWGY